MPTLLTLLRKQCAENLIFLIFIAVVALVLVTSTVGAYYLTGESIKIFMRDPVATAKLPWYTGYFSQIGGICWIATSTIALFAYMVLRRLREDTAQRTFLLFSGLFSLFLGLDDILLVHDGMFLTVGLPEATFYVIYALLLLGYVLYFGKFILRTPFLFLALAFGCFGLSILNDLIVLRGVHPYVFEDGLKLTGVLCWLTYHFLLCRAVVVAATAGGRDTVGGNANPIR